jgi:chromosome segregation ATPase
MRGGFLADDLKAALKPVIDKRVEVAAVERQLAELRSQQDAIVTDQQRLRENMKALRGSTEEKQLLQRYTRQLDEQENRLETLKTSMAQATGTLEKLRGELSGLIEKMTFETQEKPAEL